MLRKKLSYAIAVPILAASTQLSGADLPDCNEVALRAAIAAGGNYSFTCDGIIALSGELAITNHVTLDAGTHSVILSGGGSNRIFHVEAGGSLTLRGIQLVNGFSTTGGAIYNQGNLTLENCALSQHLAVGPNGAANSEGGPGRGGAIANDGYFTATSCIFSNNIARGGTGGTYMFLPEGLSGGDAEGGAIRSFGATYLTNCQFVANHGVGGRGGLPIDGNPGAGGAGKGGAIAAVSGQITIVRCSFTANRADGGEVNGVKYGEPAGMAAGGAVLSTANLGLAHSTFVDNTAAGGVSNVQSGRGGDALGGALACLAGTNFISDCRLHQNTAIGGRDWAAAQGGGIYNTAATRIERTSILTNSAVGGRAGRASSTLTKAGNGLGGGIHNLGELNFLASTLAFNRAEGGAGIDGCGFCSPPSVKQYLDGGDGIGGGIYNAATLRTTNSTIAANSTVAGVAYVVSPGVGGLPGTTAGSGVFNQTNGVARLIYSTIANNTGAATAIRTLGSLQAKATIFSAAAQTTNYSGNVSDAGYNLSSDATPTLTTTTSRTNTNPLLGLLANNGGNILTMAPLTGSPAKDAADCSDSPATDQRGIPRPQGAGCDIGAVESEIIEIATLTDNVVRSAIANGGVFQFGGNGFIPLTAPLVIARPTALHASGHLVTLSGGQSNRVFDVRPGASLTLVGLNIQDGRSTNGGGILNEGTLTLVRCVIANNVAEGRAGTNGVTGANGKIATAASPGMTPGDNGTDGEPGDSARGGGLLNLGTLVVSNSTFVGNEVIGGKGGSAGFGGRAGYGVDGFGRIRVCDQPGLPGHAGIGGQGLGAALCNEGGATIVGTTFATNSARGGTGGLGGVGGAVPCAFIAYTTTPAGNGGSASGGAWFNSGSLRIEGSLATGNLASGGVGGDAPEVSGNFGSGKGGSGGSAFGGAGADAGTNFLINSTLEANRAKGGSSGFSSHFNTIGCPHPGGNGGDSLGGALFAGAPIHLCNVTIANNEVKGGRAVATFPPGCPTEPQYQGQFLGTNGAALGDSFFASNAVTVANTIFDGTSPSNQCVGPLTDLGHNLCSDSSAAFTSATSRNNTPSLLSGLANNGGPTLTIAPRSDSPAVDAGDDALAPAFDQRGAPRPQYARSDIGAVEATFLTIERLANGHLRLRYIGIPGENYPLEGTPAFGGVWSVLDTKPAAANGRVVYSNRPPTEAQLLFRVKAP